MNQKSFKEISEEMIARYSKRYNQLGYDVKTLGWGSVEQQQDRFEQVVNELEIAENNTVLDIGCGFGDFLSLLKAQKIRFKKYIGWDINPELITEAQKIWSNSDLDTEFEVKNIGELGISNTVSDIAIMLGVLNLNLKNKIDNYEYSFQFIKNAFSCVSKVLVIDFLSTQFTPDYPKEDFVFYHNPSKMLEFALSLSSNVVLKHNYAPIPQKEFMLFIYK